MRQTVKEAARKYVQPTTFSIPYLGITGEKFLTMLSRQEWKWQSKQCPWISVEERLPEPDQLIIVAYGYYGRIRFEVLKFHTKEDLYDFAYGEEEIRAWMPIPCYP